MEIQRNHLYALARIVSVSSEPTCALLNKVGPATITQILPTTRPAHEYAEQFLSDTRYAISAGGE